MPGEKGMDEMVSLMARFRKDPPKVLGGQKFVRMRDYKNLVSLDASGATVSLDAPKGDMVILDLDGGNYVAVRPSGTEPKVKFYLFAYDAPAASADVEATNAAQADRMKKMGADLRAFA